MSVRAKIVFNRSLYDFGSSASMRSRVSQNLQYHQWEWRLARSQKYFKQLIKRGPESPVYFPRLTDQRTIEFRLVPISESSRERRKWLFIRQWLTQIIRDTKPKQAIQPALICRWQWWQDGFQLPQSSLQIAQAYHKFTASVSASRGSSSALGLQGFVVEQQTHWR